MTCKLCSYTADISNLKVGENTGFMTTEDDCKVCNDCINWHISTISFKSIKENHPMIIWNKGDNSAK